MSQGSQRRQRGCIGGTWARISGELYLGLRLQTERSTTHSAGDVGGGRIEKRPRKLTTSQQRHRSTIDPMPGQKPRVLLIDDNAIVLEMASTSLQAAGFDVHTCLSVFSLPTQIEALRPDVVVVDLLMPALSGDKVIDIIRRTSAHRCPILIYSGAPDEEIERCAASSGAEGYVKKTRDLGPLVRAVRGQLRAKPVGSE